MAKNIQKLQVVFPPGQVLFEEGDVSKEMYILLKGELEVIKNEKRLAVINANGSFIGEMATLLNAPRTAKVATTTKSVLLKVEPEDVDVLFKVTPELGYSLSRSLAERLAIMTDKVASGAGGEEPETEKDPGLTAQDLAEAEEAVDGAEAPSGPDVKFLTRTAVHMEVYRYWFNHLEMKVPVGDAIAELDFPDTLLKLILKEYQAAGLIKVDEGVIHFNYLEDFQSEAEEWIFSYGLFRTAG